LQLRRDPRIFPLLFIAPVLQLIFMGYAATLDVKQIPVVIRGQALALFALGTIVIFLSMKQFHKTLD